MKPILLLLLIAIYAHAASQEPLRVSDNKHFLVTQSGAPFFYLGDTAWELFHRLTREEATRYLENRAQLGYTVIQTVVLAEFDGLHAPNAYGHTPLINDDPAQPNEDYFAHVDWVVANYAPVGREFRIRMDKISSAKVRAWWFDPRNGKATLIGEFSNIGEQSFTSPDRNEERDWILVLDDATRNFPPPGTLPARREHSPGYQ